ncbi:MAG: OmpA family protein [Bacteroidota bacterium]|nr:OmpA family protein [Bacteroidota bacterium]
MVKHHIYVFFSTLILTAFFPATLPAQEKSVLVDRCKALDQTSPIHNIWVDADNIKWVANGNGLNKVLALDVVEKVTVPAGTTSLLMLRGGNAQIEWSTSEMQSLLGNVNISCAFYDQKSKTVWIGTREAGAFQISVAPLKIVQRLHTGNRKLTSDQINDIFIHTNGTTYIATNDGMLTGSGDKWTLQERYLNFVGVDAWGDNLWILGDDFLWQVDSRGKWNPIALDLKNVEGQIRDIAVDDEGRVWIASNMMTGYDVTAEKYQRFGPGQYFTSQFVNCLDVDADGSIWTGTKDKGLYLIQWESSLILTIKLDTPLDCKSAAPSGAISVNVAGGKPPYTYVWSNNHTTSKLTQLGTGEYSVTVNDAGGLTKSTKYVIPNPQVEAKVELIKSSSGSPVGDGSANIKANGGSGQYIYTWDNQESTQTATKLSGGFHTVTVTDKSGCSAIATLSISESLQPLTTKITILKENLCTGSPEGELMVETSGGKTPYKYAWSSQNGIEPALRDLPAGSYSVTVTDGAGNTTTSSIVLKLPTALLASIELTSPAAVNQSNGQAQAKATGGKTPYTYKWDNGETSAAIKTLSPGFHGVTVTDVNGCSSSATVIVGENISAMNASIRQTSEVKCFEGSGASLIAEVIGGKSPFQYSWNSGQRTQAIDNLKAGDYQVTITDAMSTISTANTKVIQPAEIVVTIQQESAATTKENNGRATAKANGGTGIFSFKWDTGESSTSAIKLAPGSHTVTVTDANGCTVVGETEIKENILALTVIIDQPKAILCANELTEGVKAIVTGGKEPYRYQWSSGVTTETIPPVKGGLFTLTITDATGHTATTAITIDAPLPLELTTTAESATSLNGSNGRAIATAKGGKEKYSYLWDNGEKSSRAEKLNAGTHVVTVTDNNGCTTSASVSISENIQPIVAKIKHVGDLNCTGEKSASLSVEVNGGKEPFTYVWQGNGGEWTTATISNLGAGSYTLVIKDAAGTSSNLTHEITEPEKLVVTASDIASASTGNADGELKLKVTGGKMPYSYAGKAWPANSTSLQVTNLSPGNHKLIVSDANGCSAEVSVDIKEEILPLSVSIRESNQILCAGASQGSLEAVAKGGKAPYAYSWSNGSASASITNVSAGKYTLDITDASGQKSKIDYELKAPAAMQVSVVNLRSATNDRISDGKGSIEIKGGASPYSYKWNSGETTQQATKLPLGSGSVVITDQNGCTATSEFVVREKVLPELTSERLSSGEPIRMEKIQFDADSINIKQEAIPSINELYEFLYDNPTTIIEVSGHTNGLPADEYCDRISSERAQSVASYLINKGIESRRVISKGYGKRKPVATNQTPEGRKRNQRVEVRLIKIEE